MMRTAESKVEAVQSASASLDHLTADLAALGAVPFDEGTGRRALTWSAHFSTTREEHYHDQQTGRMQRSGQVTATVALRITVRDLDTGRSQRRTGGPPEPERARRDVAC
jgi:hypothetical protein